MINYNQVKATHIQSSTPIVMKMLAILFCWGMFLQVLPVFGNDSIEETADLSALFHFEESQVYTSVAKLSALEEYVKEHPPLSLSSLQAQDHPLLSEITFENLSSFTFGEYAITPFARAIILGFCAGPLGVFIAIDMAEGKKSKLHALGGSLIGLAGVATIVIVINILVDDIIWDLFN